MFSSWVLSHSRSVQKFEIWDLHIYLVRGSQRKQSYNRAPGCQLKCWDIIFAVQIFFLLLSGKNVKLEVDMTFLELWIFRDVWIWTLGSAFNCHLVVEFLFSYSLSGGKLVGLGWSVLGKIDRVCLSLYPRGSQVFGWFITLFADPICGG